MAETVTDVDSGAVGEGDVIVGSSVLVLTSQDRGGGCKVRVSKEQILELSSSSL